MKDDESPVSESVTDDESPVFESVKTPKTLFGVEIGGWQGGDIWVGKGDLVSKKGVLGSKKMIWGQNGVIKVQIRSFWAKIGKKKQLFVKKFPHTGTFGPQNLTPENVKD